LRGLSPRTIKSYTSILNDYLLWKQSDLDVVDEGSIRKYLLRKEEQGRSLCLGFRLIRARVRGYLID
ncbi:MAG: hypothetical protein QF755_00765, partial [Candidatus Peribacteraceae bacterium]|nr:hypothetical protein [Candidatus Peribacteraceae bacterium]